VLIYIGSKPQDYLYCIRKNYKALSDGPPTASLLTDLLQNNVITDEEKLLISLKQLQKEKTEYLFDSVIIHVPSLKIGFTAKYLNLLKVIRNSANGSASNLAALLLL